MSEIRHHSGVEWHMGLSEDCAVCFDAVLVADDVWDLDDYDEDEE